MTYIRPIGLHITNTVNGFIGNAAYGERNYAIFRSKYSTTAPPAVNHYIHV